MVPQVLRLVRLGLTTLTAGALRDRVGDEVPSSLVGVAGVSGEIAAEALSASTLSSALVASEIATTHNNQPLAGASSEGPKVGRAHERVLRRGRHGLPDADGGPGDGLLMSCTTLALFVTHT